MRIRTRLSLAFFLISVVPLALVTAYSYQSSAAALRRAVEGQADQMAAEMGDRMAWVMTDLGDRVERLWRLRVDATGAGAGQPVASAPDESAASELRTIATAMLAEAAPLVRRLEFESLQARAGAADSPPAEPLLRPEPGSGRRGPDFRRGPGGGRPGPGAPGVPPEPGQRAGRMAADRPAPPGGPSAPGVPVLAPGMPRVVIEMPPVRVSAVPGQPQSALESLSPEAIYAWRRAIQRQAEREAGVRELAAMGRAPSPPEPPAAPATPAPGTGSAAAQAGRDARRAAALEAEQAGLQRRQAERAERMLALARGEALQFQVKRNGQLIGAISATVDRDRMIETVLSLGRRERGEIPFVLDASGALHTVNPDADRTARELGLAETARAALASSSTQMRGDWVVVARRDPSGIVFGLARPVRDSLREVRRASLRNLAVGLALIAAAFAVILPLASRLTRHVTALNAGVQRLAAGDRTARVNVPTADEVGELARSFNRMASELEYHDQVLAKQERLARELELCRQIQTEMLPHGPLKTALAEVAGVSIPAREVGGDFFNYFPLPDGRLALLVGDVSGKGVGAALLMANIQATLRTRLQLESDLARMVDAVDRDLAGNTPPEVYVTLFVGLLDASRRELSYVNAGHNPQFLLRKAGGIERLESAGLPVGLIPGRGFQARSIAVEPGDLLFLYTDGAVEAPNEAGEMFDTDRLQQALVAASAEGIDRVLERVEGAIREFRGRADPADDATMLALRVSTAAS